MKTYHPLKKFIFTVAAFFMFALFIFIIAEIAFRIFRGPPNPLSEITQKHSSFLFQPNTVMEKSSSKEGEFSYTARINNFGFRGDKIALEKTPGKLRIMTVGDSFTFGVGAEDNETIATVIQQRLMNQGVAVEMINAGIGHASPITHYVNLRDNHLKLKPDVVILLLDLTDLWDDWHTERNAVYDRDGDIVRFDPMFINGKRDWWITAIHHSAFCKYIQNKVVRTFKKIGELGFKNYFKAVVEGKRAKAVIINTKKNISQEAQIEYDGLLMMRGKEKKDLIEKHWVRSAGYLKKIKGMLDERNIPMILVTYPHGIYVGADEWEKGRETWGFELGKRYTDYYPFELVASFAKKEGIAFINTVDKFPISEGQIYFYNWDGHMTPKGYQTVAEGIVSNHVFKDIVK